MNNTAVNVTAVDDDKNDPHGLSFPYMKNWIIWRLFGDSVRFISRSLSLSLLNESNRRQSNIFASSVTMKCALLSVNPFANDPHRLLKCFHEWLPLVDSKRIFMRSYKTSLKLLICSNLEFWMGEDLLKKSNGASRCDFQQFSVEFWWNFAGIWVKLRSN